MYNSLLGKVIKSIDMAFRPTNEEQFTAFYNSMFNPEGYHEYLDRRRRKEDIRSKLVIGVTALAAIGESVHLAQRTQVVSKLAKKLKKE